VATVHPTVVVASTPFGLNVVGKRRQGLSSEALHPLKEDCRIVYDSDLDTSQVLAQLESVGTFPPEIQPFLDLVKRSQRGISK
jgi:UDP-N-acetylglucosamine acyltransferase